MKKLSVLVVCVALFGCGSDDDPQSNGAGIDGGTSTGTSDPNEGRDTTAPSCFAACQNTIFTCETRTTPSEKASAELTPNPDGCSGTFTKSGGTGAALKVDCNGTKVCIGADCTAGSFSAFSVGFTTGGVLTVCTRN